MTRAGTLTFLEGGGVTLATTSEKEVPFLVRLSLRRLGIVV